MPIEILELLYTIHTEGGVWTKKHQPHKKSSGFKGDLRKRKITKCKAICSRGGKESCKEKNHMAQWGKEENKSDDLQNIRIQKLQFSQTHTHIKGLFLNRHNFFFF